MSVLCCAYSFETNPTVSPMQAAFLDMAVFNQIIVPLLEVRILSTLCAVALTLSFTYTDSLPLLPHRWTPRHSVSLTPCFVILCFHALTKFLSPLQSAFLHPRTLKTCKLMSTLLSNRLQTLTFNSKPYLSYSEMFELKDAQGIPFFRTIRVSLICQACQDAGKGSECTHNADLIPPWKSAAKLDMVRALYGSNTDLMERESMGAITADADSVFNETLIDSWMQLKALDSDPNFFFMAVDPSGGGASLMGIVSSVLVGTECFIMGLDAMKVKGPEDIKLLLISHLRAVRSHPRLRNAYCIFIPENNLGMEAAHMAHMLKDERLVYTLKEKNRVGVMTTNKRKELYVQACLEYQSGMHISPQCVCVNPQLDANERLLLTKKEFRTQLLEIQEACRPW